jgi:hypothetical protein
LGASTLHNNWGNIEKVLLQKVEKRTRRKVRIFNLAQAAHSSLDDYYKYKYLASLKFDLVLLYDGFNEVRANNCPPGLFRRDYSHYAYYDDINIFGSHREAGFLVLPYLVHKLTVGIWRKYKQPEYIPANSPRREWVQYGCDIKTRECFKDNITKIVEIAAHKREPILLMTFAYYIPENYNRPKFQAKALDYGKHCYPIEIWGSPPCVQKGIELHNEVIKGISSRYPNVLFVDQDQLIPKSGRYFNDICHLSDEGCEKFVDNILEVIIKSMHASSFSIE